MTSARVAIVALYPDAGHLVPLLRIGRMLLTRHRAEVHCLVPHEAAGLAAMFELPCTPIGHALSATALQASRRFSPRTILTGTFDVYDRDYYAAIAVRSAGMVAAILADLRTRQPDVVLVDNHKFSDVFAGIGVELNRPVLFHDSTGGVHSRARRLIVNLYGRQLPMWKEAGLLTAGALFHLVRHAARQYRFRRRGLAAAAEKANDELRRLLPRSLPHVEGNHTNTDAPNYHFATGLGLLEHEVRALAPHPGQLAFGPILDFPALPLPPDLSEWLDRQQDRSVVFVSFGSMVTLSPSRLSLLAAAIARRGSPTLWVVDGRCPLRSGGRLPPNVRAEAGVPQPTVLAHPAIGACVTHGGSGTTTESLAAGVPMVVMPVMWDQPYNAQFVHELGAGLRCDWRSASARGLEDALRRVLEDTGFRARAQVAATMLRTQNGSDAVASLIASLTRETPAVVRSRRVTAGSI